MFQKLTKKLVKYPSNLHLMILDLWQKIRERKKVKASKELFSHSPLPHSFLEGQPSPLLFSPSPASVRSIFWLIVGLFTVVVLLEFSTPPDYVFGYLYIGPILLANARLGRMLTLQLTLVACVLTILNVWVPGIYSVSGATIASRLQDLRNWHKIWAELRSTMR
ncbi:MAG: hypothetical protein V7L26_28270 [Nostoc sp.]|uniref:hypothetical protein n=1 Tax=Nostoc sp. TaxID=1180 RepID=UPI002FFA2609